MIEISKKQDVTDYLIDYGILIQPSAIDAIMDYEDTNLLLDYIVENNPPSKIDKEYVKGEIEEFQDNKNEEKNTRQIKNNSEETDNRIDPEKALERLSRLKSEEEEQLDKKSRKDELRNKYPDLYNTLFDRNIPDIKPRERHTEYTVEFDVTGESTGKGDVEDFESLFTDRYNRLYNIIKEKCSHAIRVKNIKTGLHSGENLTICGLVWDKWSNDNDNYFLELEDVDTNESFRVVFTDDSFKERFERIVLDEFIAVRGTVSDDGGILFGDSEKRQGRPPIMFPGVNSNRSKTTKIFKETKAAFISDIHIGADEFFPEYWNEFIDWVRTTPSLKYIFIAGDIVEGVGVYPNQDEELEVVDIKDQYALAGRMFEEIPEEVDVIASVGNHDSIRLAEPQPTLYDKYTYYFPDNVEFVSNPAMVSIENISILLYHGMSINTFAELVPSIDISPPTDALELMMEKRHLSPTWGKNVRLAPEETDYLVIDEVPDVLHCGHVHKYGVSEYEGVNLLNTACWQGQTDFQKSKGIEPDVGYWSVMELSTGKIDTKKASQIT